MKKCKKIIFMLAVMLLVCNSTGIIFAATFEDYRNTRMFNRAYVDSNTFSTICYSNSYYSSVSRTGLYVNEILKTDGSNSSYKKVKAKMIVNVYNSDVLTVNKGNVYYIDVPDQYRDYGGYMLSAMGNNPSLDCLISGGFSIYN